MAGVDSIGPTSAIHISELPGDGMGPELRDLRADREWPVHRRTLAAESEDRGILRRPDAPEVASDAAVVAYVGSRPGAVGYVSSRASLVNVKVVTISDG